jgi:hypothetical protein
MLDGGILHSDFLLLTSYFLLLTSYFLLLTSYFLLLTSYFLLLTSYFLLLTSALPLNNLGHFEKGAVGIRSVRQRNLGRKRFSQAFFHVLTGGISKALAAFL